jgi:hypothetical protein
MTDRLFIAPLAEPIHLDEARAHLRAPSGQTAQDAQIKGMIRAARSRAEALCRLALVRQQRVLKLDSFDCEIELPVRPLRAVQSITYVDSAGETQTLASSAYRVLGVVGGVGGDAPAAGRIEPAYGTVWPSTLDITEAVTVKYTAGFAVPVSTFDTSGDAVTAAGHDLVASDPARLSNSGGVVQSGLSLDLNYYVKAPATDTLQLSLTDGGAAVDITATTAGTGTTFVGVIPPDIISALLLIVEHLYQNRSENSDFEIFEMPLGADRLLQPFRPYRF